MTQGRFLAGRKAWMLKAGVSGTLYLGLATGAREMPDGALQLYEVNDRAYVRQPVTFGEPELGEPVTVANDEIVQFPGYADDSAQPLRHWFLCTVPDGLPGEIVAQGDLAPREVLEDGTKVWTRPRRGEGPQFLPGDILLSLGDETP